MDQKRSCSDLCQRGFYLFFSSKSFTIASLTFMSLIHFEFTFVYGVKEYSNFIISHVTVQFFQVPLTEKTVFS